MKTHGYEYISKNMNIFIDLYAKKEKNTENYGKNCGKLLHFILQCDKIGAV